jgi:amidase
MRYPVTDLHYLTITDLIQSIKSGERSAVEVTTAIFERIHEHDSTLKSYARLMEQEAIETAQRLDDDRAAGKPLGALHGVPVAIKDLLNTRGVRTASGTKVMADYIPEEDATVVTRLKEAGAVIVGKTQMTEGAWSSHHPDIPAPLNPWNHEYWTGVSSSGTGVATAAGLCYGGLGTDTAGSIRFPSACCGLVGLKPTFGRVSKAGAFALADSLDHIGPLTRSVEDNALMMQVLAGYDPADPNSIDAPVPDYLASLKDGVRGLKIGMDRKYISCAMDPAVVENIENVVQVFKELGVELVEVDMPDHGALVAGSGVTVGAEVAMAHQAYYPEHKNLYGSGLQDLIDGGRAASAVQYADMEREREVFRAGVNQLFQQVDLLLAPAMIVSVPDLGAMDVAVADLEVLRNFITYTVPFNYSGHPALTMPTSLDSAGLPQSFQLIGPMLGEAGLLQAGYAFEEVAGFKDHPM